MDEGLIYKIQNKVNGKLYIGKAFDFNKRKKEHLSTLRSKKHHNPYLQRSYNKYGESNFAFSVLAVFSSKFSKSLDELEKYWIFRLNTRKSGYNLTDGGDGSRGLIHTQRARNLIRSKALNRKHSEETKAKISYAKKGKKLKEDTKTKSKSCKGLFKGSKNPMYGRTFSEEHRRKISEAFKGKKHPMFNKTHSEESKIKISKAGKGRKHSEETKAKMSKARSGSNNPKSKKVIDVTTGFIFDSLAEAAQCVKIKKSTLSLQLRGLSKNKTNLKYIDYI